MKAAQSNAAVRLHRKSTNTGHNHGFFSVCNVMETGGVNLISHVANATNQSRLSAAFR